MPLLLPVLVAATPVAVPSPPFTAPPSAVTAPISTPAGAFYLQIDAFFDFFLFSRYLFSFRIFCSKRNCSDLKILSTP
jgi:hypothetical protein